MRMRAVVVVAMVIIAALFAMPSAHAEQCGEQAGGAACPNCMCCSKYGWCGTTSAYCGVGCQGQCDGSCGGTTPNNTAPAPVVPPIPTPSPRPRLRPRPTPTPKPKPPKGGGGSGVASIITEDMFNQMLLHRDDANCPAKGFYTYADFIAAAKAFPGFGTTGSADARKRELAAFLAQTSHETTGGWPTAPDGEFAWGYCFKEEQGAAGGPDFCEPSTDYPCAPGKKYYGRGPIQISYNLNYGQAAKALGADILANPDLVAADPKIAFETAVWFWMTPQSPKPSCHDVMTGKWKPSAADTAAGRLPGYGVVTNIINGIECDHGDNDARVAGRIGFYKRYCDMLGVSYGDNLDCGSQTPFGQS